MPHFVILECSHSECGATTPTRARPVSVTRLSAASPSVSQRVGALYYSPRPVFVPASGIFCVSKLNLFLGTMKVGTNYRIEIFFGVESFALHDRGEDLMWWQD